MSASGTISPPVVETLRRTSTRVKICGITNIADARIAAEAGADFLGYNLYPKSPRYIAPPQVRAITNLLRIDFPELKHVGVFVDAPAEGVCQTLDLAGLDMAQLHGTETTAYCGSLAERGVRHIKAMRFGGTSAPSPWSDFPTAEFYLCDTYDPINAGGTGREFDHSLLPRDLPLERTFLAGGLTPENIATAVAEVRPFAVDVSSGVELSPGRKSAEKIKTFIQQTRKVES
ncbi:MAG: phosphoribosylanthranilate isomerase [Candidatus Sumerlaeaceae bacterium]